MRGRDRAFRGSGRTDAAGGKNKSGGWGLKLFALIFWLAVWEIAAILTGSDLILPGILTTLGALAGLLVKAAFWQALLTTFLRFLAGVFLSVLLGLVIGIASAFLAPVKALSQPFVSVVRSLPVVSVSILLNLWLKSPWVPLAVTFFVCFPVTWTNVVEGIESTDAELIEMADLYGVSFFRKLKDLYLPAIEPFTAASLITGFGMGWKSTVTAEVLANVQNSAGMDIYYAKLYLNTPELFAWTFVLIAVSMLTEAILRACLLRRNRRRRVSG